MILSIHSSAFVEGSWPKTWPPVKLPPPPPLDAAADSLWSPKAQTKKQGGVGLETSQGVASTASLYSTQLRQEGHTTPGGSEGRFQMAFLDQRIALMRYDASHEAVAA